MSATIRSDALSPADQPIFEALLTPHRSLGRTGFNRLMLGLGAIGVFTGIGFVANGAWPVMGFFGLDVLLIWLAFRASYRAARATEEVRVSRTQLTIRKVSPKGDVREASYNPAWARFQVSRHEEIGVTGMAVSGEGRRTEIGAFLNPPDRESFAAELSRALADARRG